MPAQPSQASAGDKLHTHATLTCLRFFGSAGTINEIVGSDTIVAHTPSSHRIVMPAAQPAVKTSLSWNVGATWGVHAIGLVIGFFLMPYVVRTLGDSAYGS